MFRYISKKVFHNSEKISYQFTRYMSTTDRLIKVNFDNGIKTLTMCNPKTRKLKDFFGNISTSFGQSSYIVNGCLILICDSDRNALSMKMMEELMENLLADQEDVNLRTIVIAAEGPVFSAGHNLKEMTSESGPQQHERIFTLCTELMMSIINSPVPVIAKVNGLAAAAGCQLVAQCDIAICSDKSSFMTPGATFGLFCSTPGVALARCIPKMTAMHMLLTGLPLSSAEAKQSGLVSKVCSEDALEDEVNLMCKAISSKSRSVIELGKRFYYKQIQVDLKTAYQLGGERMVSNLNLKDGKEGIRSFVEKRKAVWSHTFNK